MKHVTFLILLTKKLHPLKILFLIGIITLAITQSIFAQASFTSKVDLIAGSQPTGVAMGDFNGDGKADIAVANGGANTVSVFVNTTTPGSTTAAFSAKTDFTCADHFNAVSVSIGDFNGDGKNDMAVTYYTTSKVAVFLNTTTPGAATPAFGTPASFTTGTSPNSVSIGDFNGDGKNDMAVTNNGSATVSIFLNTTTPGATTPTFSAKTDLSTGTNPYSVAIGDLNGDGKNDVASANSGATSVSVFLNTTSPGATTPTFSAKTDFGTGSTPYSVSIGDMNGDGNNDMAVANYHAITVSVFLNTATPGAGTPAFTAKTDFTTGDYPSSVSIGDLNGDGKNDMAVANNSSANVSVFLNTTTPGSTTPAFAAKTDFATGADPQCVAIGEFNGDGKNDLAVANQTSSTASVFINTTSIGVASAAFSNKTDVTAGTNPQWIATGDFNGDGKLDVAVANNGTTTVSVLLNTTTTGASTPTFSAKTDFTAGTSPQAVSVGDINGDGKSDIAVANSGSATISVFLNTTTTGDAVASFSAKTDFSTATNPSSISMADFNGDGAIDMAVTNNGASGDVSVFLNTTTPGAATPTFAARSNFATGTGTICVATADFNGDGKIDMAVVVNFEDKVSVLLNTTTPGAATATFSTKEDFIAGSDSWLISLGDFNGDGKCDMAIADRSDNSFFVYLNTTDPGATTPAFSAKEAFGTGQTIPNSIAVGDFNGDGMIDIAVANRGSTNASISLSAMAPGATTASFAGPTGFATGSQPYSIATGDFNGDGKSDVATANYAASTVSVFLNLATLPLPVELTSFIASASNDAVSLYWSTATEVNNYGFEIERRAVKSERSTMDSWQKIGFVSGAGTSNAPKEYSYWDATASSGSHVYRLKQIDQDGSFKYSQSVEVSFMKPAKFGLDQNYPNPFNPTTIINYTVPSVGTRHVVSLRVYDMLGREVAVLVNGQKEPGSYSAEFNGAKYSSGIYFFKLTTDQFSSVRKMLMIK